MKHLGQRFKYALVPLLAATLPGCSFGPSSQYSAASAPVNGAAYFVDPSSGASYGVALPQPLATRNLPTLKVAATTRDNMLLFSPRKTISDAQPTLFLAAPLDRQTMADPLTLEEFAAATELSADEFAPLRLDHSFGAVTRMVPFAVNRSSLGPLGRKAVAELVPIVKEAKHVYVRGRTDVSGDARVNEALAARRANTVANAFVAAGVRNAKITSSQCIDCFVASNTNYDGRQLNRRVDVEMQLPKARIAQLPPAVYALETPPLTLARSLTYPRQ